MKAEVTARSYEVEIPYEAFQNLSNHEWHEDIVPLHRHLEGTTADGSVEYNGHFGCYVFFTIESDFDTPAEREKILKKIQKYLDDANT